MKHPIGELIKENDEKILTVNENAICCPTEDRLFEIRDQGNFKSKGFYLSNLSDWIIVKDDQGMLVLLELRK